MGWNIGSSGRKEDAAVEMDAIASAPTAHDSHSIGEGVLGSEKDGFGVGAGELTLEEDTRGGLGRHLGVFSTTFLIFGRIIGSGIFSTPSSITESTGSVGAALLIWLLGFGISMAGLLVWLELGCMIPRSGGEKVYLEAAYSCPRHMITIVYAIYSVLLGFSATGCITFASYMAEAAGRELSDRESRGIAACAMIFVALMHGLVPRWGVRVMNVVGIIKIIILLFVVVSGWAILRGADSKIADPGRSFRQPFANSTSAGNPYATALFKVLSSFAGWQNAAYILNEVKDPVRTLKIAGPLAVSICGVLYMLANVSYYSALTPTQTAESKVVVAAEYMRSAFGEKAARAISVFVAISALGNVMTVTFAHSRVDQEIAKEGVLPFSTFWASTWPTGAPTGGLLLHFIPSIIMITAIPFGDAYNFIVDIEGYARAIIFMLAVLGLFILRRRYPDAERPFKIWIAVAIFYAIAQAFLLIAPFLRPPGGVGDTSLPYWLYPIVAIGVVLCGVCYYVCFVHIVPLVFGGKLEKRKVVLRDGTTVMRFVRTKEE